MSHEIWRDFFPYSDYWQHHYFWFISISFIEHAHVSISWVSREKKEREGMMKSREGKRERERGKSGERREKERERGLEGWAGWKRGKGEDEKRNGKRGGRKGSEGDGIGGCGKMGKGKKKRIDIDQGSGGREMGEGRTEEEMKKDKRCQYFCPVTEKKVKLNSLLIGTIPYYSDDDVQSFLSWISSSTSQCGL